MTDDLVKRLREKTGLELECVAMDAADRIEMLENALDQLLDDMGEDGLCVCQAAKDQAIEALGKTNDKSEV